MKSNVKKKPKVTIIIPAYNCQNTIEKSIHSLLNQTYNNLEVIVVNDGSIDNTKNIIEKIASIDKRVFYYNIDNHGVSYSRNYGLSKATGEYVMFLDSDDYYIDNTVDICVKNLLKSDSDLLIFGMIFNYLDKKNTITKNIKRNLTLDKNEINQYFAELYSNNLLSSCCNKIYKSKLAKKIIFDKSISTYEDLLYVTNYLKKCKKIDVIKENLYIYNISNNETLSKKYKVKMYDEIYLLEKKLRKCYSDLNIVNFEFINNQKYFFSIIIIKKFGSF